jgi:hypothetical protein
MPENPYGNSSVRVRVDEVLKGHGPPEIVIEYPGTPPDWPARGRAEAEGVTGIQLAEGDRRLFLLTGGSHAMLADLHQGIQPMDSVPLIIAMLQEAAVQADIAVRAYSSTTVTVVVTLRNTTARPLALRLPQRMADACRVWSWLEEAGPGAMPLLPPQPLLAPTPYHLISQDAGVQMDIPVRLQVNPMWRRRTTAPVSVAACVYYLLPDAYHPSCAATVPIEIQIPASPSAVSTDQPDPGIP